MYTCDRSSRAVLLAVCIVSGVIAVPNAEAAEVVGNPSAAAADVFGGYASTHIIVRFSPAMAAEVARRRASVGVNDPQAARLSPLDVLNSRWAVSEIRSLYSDDFGDIGLAAEFGLDRTVIITVRPGTDTPAMVAAYAALPGVELAELDGIGGVAGPIPNDPSFDLQWGMHNVEPPPAVADADIDAPEAWAIHNGLGGSVIIAVVDSGITPHVEFADRLLTGRNTNDPATPDYTLDDCPHGTHVAGILAAGGNNGVGLAGVSWGASLMPVRVVDGCTGTESQCAAGIRWAADNGAHICNLSLQYYTGTQALRNAVNYAYGRGVVLIAAAGNDHGATIAFPASFPNVMAVTASNNRDELAGFSNYGNEADISAPGDDIWSTWIGNGYMRQDGTSMATPHVSGVAALMKSYVPDLTNSRIRFLLTSTADDLGPEGWDVEFGHGRVNAYAALLAADTSVAIIASAPPTGAIDARQPSEVDGGNPAGWQEIDLTFDGDAYELTPADFAVFVEGGGEPAPAVVDVAVLARSRIRVLLSEPIEPRAWTTVTHTDSGSSVRLGYLPGDVDGDTICTTFDLMALIDALNGVGQPRAIWSTDINRSQATGSADILRLIDLLNGAGAYDPYYGAALP